MSTALEKLKELCDKATPGPWNNVNASEVADKKVRCISAKVIKEHNTSHAYLTGQQLPGLRGEIANALSHDFHLADEEAISNAAFIAEARTALPLLIEKLELAEKALSDLVCNSALECNLGKSWSRYQCYDEDFEQARQALEELKKWP